MDNRGYNEFRKKMQNYRNPARVGITIGRLISITPVTIEVKYEGEPFTYTVFKSVVSMESLRKEDIGKQYIVEFTSDNQTLFVIDELKYYKDYYIET